MMDVLLILLALSSGTSGSDVSQSGTAGHWQFVVLPQLADYSE